MYVNSPAPKCMEITSENIGACSNANAKNIELEVAQIK
jgi:hypothetical protein